MRISGANVKCPVGADDPVRPLGNGVFAAAYRKNGHAPCGESAASTPTNGIRIRRWCVRICGCVLPGGQRRPPLRVRTVPHWFIQFCYVIPRGRGRTPPLRLGWQHTQNPRVQLLHTVCVLCTGIMWNTVKRVFHGRGCGKVRFCPHRPVDKKPLRRLAVLGFSTARTPYYVLLRIYSLPFYKRRGKEVLK